MCTNFVLINKNGVTNFSDRLLVNRDGFLYSSDIRPGAAISIVTGDENNRQIRTATWWLYLQQTPQGLRPHKDYFSVNSNYQKLDKRPEYKRSRCIIPATAFVESQNGKHPHLLEPEDDRVMAFGGLYKEWTDKVTGEIVTSASIITLAGHPALENIHRKSTPLWLSESDYDQWLDPIQTDTACFDRLLTPTLQTRLRATPIDKVTAKNPIGDAFLVG